MTISLLLHTNTNNIIASPKSRNTEKMLWFSEIRRKFGKISCKSVAVLNHSNLIHDGSTKEEDDYRVASFTDKGTGYCQDDESNGKSRKVLTLEDLAAIKIQTCFRGHLARRAFRALKGLVKLQALVRGASVRRQARIAVHCMQAMVRLQVKVRARQLLRNSGDLELLQP